MSTELSNSEMGSGKTTVHWLVEFGKSCKEIHAYKIIYHLKLSGHGFKFINGLVSFFTKMIAYKIYLLGRDPTSKLCFCGERL